MEARSLRFAATARALGEAARRAGYVAPTFRSPPKVAGRMRTIRWHGNGSATVSLVVKARPWAAVVADMIEGFVAVNKVRGDASPNPATPDLAIPGPASTNPATPNPATPNPATPDQASTNPAIPNPPVPGPANNVAAGEVLRDYLWSAIEQIDLTDAPDTGAPSLRLVNDAA